MKTIIGIPRPVRWTVPWEFVESLLPLARENVIFSQAGAYIDENRNNMLKVARKYDADCLMMIDGDMVFTCDDFTLITQSIANGYDIVGGLYRMGAQDNKYIVFSEKDGKYEPANIEEGKGLQEVEAIGTGFMALSKKIIHEENPFTFLEVNGVRCGEDISFCHRMRGKGYKVMCDTDVKVGHIRYQIL